MVSVNQVRRGIEKYLESEVMPHLAPAKAFGFGVYTELLLNTVEPKVGEYLNSPALKLLQLSDSSGQIDIDRLREVAVSKMPEHLPVDIPAIGRFTFSRNDIERLCDLIKSQ